MKILWLINIPLPEVSLLLGEKPSPFGGWLINASKGLASKEEIELSISFPYKGAEHEKIKGNKINYYPFKPIKDKDKKLINYNENFERILQEIKPDIVHIYGTELAHSLAMVNVCNKLNIRTVISIQGLVSIIEKHIYANLPINAIYGMTFRNFIMKDNVYGLRKVFKRRGKNEVETIRKTRHVIGRTTWDKACISQINPNVKYYSCNETLREEFYKYNWNINDCERYSIFLSQGQYPIKGLHYVLEAMSIVLKKFPQTKLYVSGKDITKADTFKDKLLMTYYGKYIKKLIKKYNLMDNIIFTGPLDEKEMCNKFLKSHIFVSPSTIENESNSLSEAKILGLPCVVSYCGGVIDRVKHGIDGFHYQHDAPYMLAHYICVIFGDDKLALKCSENAKENARKTHDKKINVDKTIDIYRQIFKL